MAAQPNYVYSERWGCVLNTTGRPEGYGRVVGLTKVIKIAALRGGQAKHSSGQCDPGRAP
jgi:hypothetical protein